MSQPAGSGCSESSLASPDPLQPGSGSLAPAASRASTRPSPSSSRPFAQAGWAPGVQPPTGSTSSATSPLARLSAIVTGCAQSAGPVRWTVMSSRSVSSPCGAVASATGAYTSQAQVPPETIAAQEAAPGAAFTSTSRNVPQPELMPTNSSLGSPATPAPEPAAHSADTGTSPVSDGSPACSQPGSAQSACPSPSSSRPLSHGRPAAGGGLGFPVGGRGVTRLPPRAGGAGAAGGGPRRRRASSAAAPAGAGLPHSFAATTAPSPRTSSEPFSRLPNSPASVLHAAPARPPPSAAGDGLTPRARPPPPAPPGAPRP